MSDDGNGTREIRVDYLARVEGEGRLYARVRDGELEDVEFGIFEPPRFFEAFLRGRPFTDAPDITARICGICPVAYQMSSVHAMERARRAVVDGELRTLRRLLYCGEWLESHGLHVYMLHAPDFLGYESAVHMAADHREVVEQGLRLKRAGNAIVTLLGGREVHPINVRVGGFYRAPTMHELQTLVPELEWARDAAAETARWTAQLPMPDIEIDYDFVSLRHPDEYPFNEGRIVSTSGLDIAAEEWPEHFVEEHKERSNALHAYFRSGGMFKVGPLARFALNADRLTPLAANVVAELGLSMPCRNPFQSIVVRSIEMVFAAEEALRIISEYKRPPESFVPIEPGPGVGSAATEAPRGLLWHRYELDEAGRIAEARIVPPTSQNQAVIESDVRRVLGEHLHLDDEALTWRLEQTIRNYDPCISCATHFLKVEIDRA